MKNRLEIARELLRDDGVIFVQCDDNEQAYLKVLMDEIFGKENFVACMPRITKKAGKSTDTISKNHDYILLYKKQFLSLSQLEVDENNYPLKDKFFSERGGYKLSQTLDYDSLQYSVSMDYIAEINGVKFYAGGYEKWLERQNGQHKKIDWVWRWSKDKLEFGLANGFVEVKGNRIYTKTYLNATISKSKPYIVETIKRGKNLSSIEFVENQYSNDMASKNIQQVFNEKNLFNYSKPEALIKKLLEISTQENDLVLDFFAGSGTTMAVAHKMKRRCITIEQMDYIQNITKERIKKVIEGEQGGISKAVSWSGGGNVVYCELAPLNAYFVEKIQNSRNEAELESIIASMSEKAFIDYRVDIKKVLEDKKFSTLSLEDKKATLIDCLDRNMDYIPYADINDSEYKISDEAKKLNKIFYNKGE